MIVDEEFNEKENITHIEMYHHHCHYDVIASIESEKICVWFQIFMLSLTLLNNVIDLLFNLSLTYI